MLPARRVATDLGLRPTGVRQLDLAMARGRCGRSEQESAVREIMAIAGRDVAAAALVAEVAAGSRPASEA